MRLLLVEDHVPLADELMASLTRQGYAVDWLADGRDAAVQGASEPYDLIILDLGLPGRPGLEIPPAWGGPGTATPVLVPHPGQVLSKGHLAEHLYDGETERDSNVIEVHVNHLRRKLGREVIETRRGQGYRYAGVAAG